MMKLEMIQLSFVKYSSLKVCQNQTNPFYFITHDELLLEVCSVDRPMLKAAFPLNAKKVRICEIISGGFTVKIQQCVKKSCSFW